MSDPDADEFARPIVQRTVNAADAPPVQTTGRSSVWDIPWRPKPEAEPDTDSVGSELTGERHESSSTPTVTSGTSASAEPPPPTSTPEGEPMPKKNGAARARKSANGSPQLQICSLLLQNDVAVQDLHAALPSLKRAQIYSALHNAIKNKRVKWKDSEQVYTLTSTGRQWVEAAGGAAAEPPVEERPARKGAGGKSAAHRRGLRARKTTDAGATVDTSPPAGQAPTFRCAVMSDGCFFITKDGTTIELEPEEHKQMLHYLERMAEAADAT